MYFIKTLSNDVYIIVGVHTACGDRP